MDFFSALVLTFAYIQGVKSHTKWERIEDMVQIKEF